MNPPNCLNRIKEFVHFIWVLFWFILMCAWTPFFGILYFVLCPYLDETDDFALTADHLNHFTNWM